MNKKIIYIGDFIQPYSTERYITHAFTQLGYEVLCIQEDRLMIKNADEMFQEVKEMNPIFVLFSKGKPMGESEKFINLMKSNGIRTIVWLFDLYFDLPADRKFKLEKKIAPFNSELIFSTDGGHDKNFEDLGINHKCLRQGIHAPEAILYDLPKTHEIIFVGGDVYRTRHMLLIGLKEHYGSKFEWFGWNHKNIVRGLDLNKLYASTKVVVGDSQPSKRYWSNRIYETLGRGGFLLHPYVEGLEEEFEIGKDLVCYPYGDFGKLHELIDYYLEHEDEREAIRKHGHETVKNKYTYKNRCEQFLKMI
jgi:hypothetical protein